MALVIEIEIQGTEEFRKLARDLRAAGNGKLTRRLRAGMRRAAEPMLADAKANVSAITSKGVRGSGTADRAAFVAGRSRRLTERVQERIKGHTGLRAATAHATRLEVTTTGGNAGVRLRCSRNQMPANQRKLPVHLNTGKWRHPTHGNREAWVTQTATPPGWFSRSVQNHGPRVRDAADVVVNELIAEVANG